MKGITKKQLDIFSFIESFIDKHHYSPSYRDIQQQFGFSSLGTVYNYIKRLEKRGILAAERKSSRSLAPAEPSKKKSEHETEVPLIGIIRAGFPIEIFLHEQQITIPRSLAAQMNTTYALRAKGDSLNEELIADGDLLIIDTGSAIENGDTIVALINAHDTLVKRYFLEEGFIRLESKTPHHRPIIVREQNITIQGRIKAVIREL